MANNEILIGRTLIVMGELAVARAAHPAVYEHFSQPLNAFEGISAVPDACRVRDSLAAL